MGSPSPKPTVKTSPETFSYQAFGLMIESSVACPELLPHPGRPDVYLHYGTVPDALEGGEPGEPSYEVTPDAFLLKIPGIARYLVRGGKEIVVEPAPGAPDHEVRLFLLGSAFGALFHQRGLLSLHGCALEVDGGAVIFVGDSGTGKSTLAGALHQRGFRVISDDVSVLSFSHEGHPMAQPSCTHVKLGAEILLSMGKKPAAYPQVMSELAKHLVPLGEGFCAQPRQVKEIYELTTHDAQDFQIVPLQGAEKLTVLIAHTYRLAFLEGPAKRKHYFTQCGRLARQASISRLFRPPWPFGLEKLVEFLEREWT